MRIAVDAMGGDHAPVRIIKGCVRAAATLGGDAVVLLGDEERLQTALHAEGAVPANLSIHHAPDTIGMHEHPVEAVRSKPQASVVTAVQMLEQGQVDAVVSAGNTGATVVAASMLLKTLAGIKRPGIAVSMPTPGGLVTLLDAGANLACRPMHLLKYAIMASHYVRCAHGVERPRVGLLNVGEEATKGTELVQAAHALLEKADLNYMGNVEGHDLFGGTCDIVVTDGFTGNCVLKATEGLVQALRHDSSASSTQHGAVEALDYNEHGGAPLLGVNGVVIICHGRSDERAIDNAVKLAARLTRSGLNEAIVKDVLSLSNAGA